MTRSGSGMWVFRILVLLVVIAGGWWLYKAGWPQAAERPLFYEKGTYLGTHDTPLDELGVETLQQRARRQAF